MIIFFISTVLSINLYRDPIVNLDYSSFRGRRYNKINHFLGIPFAQPPIGNLRFRPPEQPLPTNKTRDALRLGPGCMQKLMLSSGLRSRVSEDCLHLNIWTPESSFNSTTKLPVLVWIYGGAFKSGLSSSPFFDGQAMMKSAPKDSMIFVTFNYRVGVFGFLASKELHEENATNLGLLDQEAALKWVKKYISEFGGDPNRITVSGESAGAISIGAHLLANEGKQDLFHQAILESGSILHVYPTISDGQSEYNNLTMKTNCDLAIDTLDCLRKVPAKKLLKATENMEFRIHMDGLYIQYQPYYSLMRGNFSKIPIVIGTNTDEGTFFTVETVKSPENVSQYQDDMIPFANISEKNQLTQLYPLQDYKEPYLAAADFIGDYLFNCPSLLIARLYSKYKIPVYKYRWNHEFTMARFILQKGNSSLGVFHFSEVPFVFNIGWMQVTRQESRLGRLVNHMWVNFVTTGNPNLEEDDNDLYWPRYDQSFKQLIFQTPLHSITLEQDDGKLEKCKFYEKVGRKNIFTERLRSNVQ